MVAEEKPHSNNKITGFAWLRELRERARALSKAYVYCVCKNTHTDERAKRQACI